MTDDRATSQTAPGPSGAGGVDRGILFLQTLLCMFVSHRIPDRQIGAFASSCKKSICAKALTYKMKINFLLDKSVLLNTCLDFPQPEAPW